MPNVDAIERQAQIVNGKGSAMLVAIQAFQRMKVAGEDLTAAQKTALRTDFTDTLAAVKAATAIIDTELAK